MNNQLGTLANGFRDSENANNSSLGFVQFNRTTSRGFANHAYQAERLHVI